MKKINKRFRFYYLAEILSLLLLIMIILLLTTSIFNFEIFYYFNNYISVKNILATILFLIIVVLKNDKKINMIIIYDNFKIKELIYSTEYFGILMSLLILNIYIGNLYFILGLTIVFLEIFIIFSLFYKNSIKEINRNVLKIWKLKDLAFVILMFFLLLDNYPFEIINFPMTTILTFSYLLININTIYKIYE